MTMYKYYAVIEKDEESGSFIVTFPDVTNCFTDAKTLPKAVESAHDVLELMITDYIEAGNIPVASPANSIKVPEGASLVLVSVEVEDSLQAM